VTETAITIDPAKPQKIATTEIFCDENKSQELDTYWYDLIERSQVSGLVQQLAKHCALIQQTENEQGLLFDLLLESVHKHLLSDKMKLRLQSALSETLASQVKLEINECQVNAQQQLQTPRRREIQEAEILQQEAVKSIMNDEKLALLVNSFSAVIREKTIKPLSLDSKHTIH